MVKNYLLLFFVYSTLVFSQNSKQQSPLFDYGIDTKTCKSFYPSKKIISSHVDDVKQYLATIIPSNGNYSTELRLSNMVQSKTAKHFLFDQYLNNTRIYRAQVKVSINNNNIVQSVFDNSFVFSSLEKNFPSIATTNTFISKLPPLKYLTQENVYFYKEPQLVAAIRIEYIDVLNNSFEIILDENNTILYKRDLCLYYKLSTTSQDSLVSASVFLPDPLTTAGVTYGGVYVDNNDNDTAALNNQRVVMPLNVYYSGDTFYLRNQYAKITEFDNPVVAPAFEVSNPSFNYTRKHNGFEDVNTLFHISEFQKHIQNLGFTNLVNYSIEVDAHAMNGSDNSKFLPGPTNRLFFGEGGVDDAEDADVIIHEYGHAISHSAAPNTVGGSERIALEEAIGDYFASSYSRFLNSFNWDNVFSWDGHNVFWSGRQSTSNKKYPTDLISNLYADAEIWSSTLMEIWGDIGRNKTDEIVLESMYGYASNMTMSDAARLCIQADSNLNGGQNFVTLCSRFYDRGLLVPCGPSSVQLIDAVGDFVSRVDNNNLYIDFVKSFSGKVSLYDLSGRVIAEEDFLETKTSVLSLNNVPSGLYFVVLSNSEKIKSFKAVVGF
ncbi:MAG: T9SS type A sorting domain-containing protein [Bacteroidetes bacterium]|nr:T9SS type A sorting domain-containing protein [Bacteroidota bacterium]